MRGLGWRAGFLKGSGQIDALMGSERPVLAVVDYAEGRADLREMLGRVAGRESRTLRLLLLARNADAWWRDLCGSDGLVGDLLKHEEPLELEQVAEDREGTFREAVRAFGGVERIGVVPNLAHPRFARVLYVHAAALATAQGREVKADALMDDTLDHEERFWREQLKERGPAEERKAVHKMRLTVAELTLKGGASGAEAEALAGDEAMGMLLRDLYPGREPGYVGGLEPDLLGEAMVWRALRGEGAGAGAYLDRVFDGADEAVVRTGFTVLGRLSEDRDEAAGWIAWVLGRDVVGRAMAAFAAAKAVGEQTAHAAIGRVLAEALEREGTIEIAEWMEAELPHPQQTVSLREVGRWVFGKRLQHLPEGRDEERARFLNNLGNRQSALGQREAALASAVEAVDLYRKLADSRPVAFLPDLATSLNNLGIRQSALGQREAALASTQEALDLRRKLAASRPEAFLPDLAVASTTWATSRAPSGNGRRRWLPRWRRSTSTASWRIRGRRRSCPTSPSASTTWATRRATSGNGRRRWLPRRRRSISTAS